VAYHDLEEEKYQLIGCHGPRQAKRAYSIGNEANNKQILALSSLQHCNQ